MKKFVGVAVLSVIFLSSCIGPTSKRVMSYRHNNVYLKKNESYKVGSLPSPWRRMRVRAHAIAFHHPGVGATVATDAFCGPSFEDVPVKVLTSHLIAGVEDHKVVGREKFVLDGRGAIRTVANGSIDGVPFTFDIVVLKKNRCIIDFMCVAPHGRHEEVISDFENFYRGFHYE